MWIMGIESPSSRVGPMSPVPMSVIFIIPPANTYSLQKHRVFNYEAGQGIDYDLTWFKCSGGRLGSVR
jgi:hypothetical protein